ncbi:5833_t:CDS:2 [Entrophospora sp. SA101]|nr:5833_t:CDS:2 [Entrophospora sp. SA101]
MSDTNTPASTSTSVIENESVMLAEEIKKYRTKELIDFLHKEENLDLVQEDYDIIKKERINGRDFLKISKKDLRSYGMPGGPATRLAEFAKECKEKKKKVFSSYKSLKDVLEKYGIRSDSITSIPQFTPVLHPIDESSKEFKLCIDDILRRIKNMGPVIDSNEAMRCEYISTILHTAVSIVGGLVILPQMNVSGEESTGHVDYAIKKILDDLFEETIYITEGKQNQPGKGVAQNLMQCRSSCEMNLDMFKKKRKAEEVFESEYEYVYGIVTTATDWYFILHSTEAIYCTSKTEYRISLTEDALDDDTDLCKYVKRILEVIVGLLKDRVSVSNEPSSKRRCVQEKIKKK